MRLTSACKGSAGRGNESGPVGGRQRASLGLPGRGMNSCNRPAGHSHALGWQGCPSELLIDAHVQSGHESREDIHRIEPRKGQEERGRREGNHGQHEIERGEEKETLLPGSFSPGARHPPAKAPHSSNATEHE